MKGVIPILYIRTLQTGMFNNNAAKSCEIHNRRTNLSAIGRIQFVIKGGLYSADGLTSSVRAIHFPQILLP